MFIWTASWRALQWPLRLPPPSRQAHAAQQAGGQQGEGGGFGDGRRVLVVQR